MKILIALALIAAPATAQTLDQRADKIIIDANLAENAMQRVMAETKRLKADIAAGELIAAPLPVDGAPVVTTPPTGEFASPSLAGLDAIPSNFNRSTQLLSSPIPSSAAPDVMGAFRFLCQPSHLNYDDPIVYPGVIGGSPHMHQWFGNTLGNGKSTFDTLRTSGDSTCMGPLNRSAYWVPAMIDQNEKVVQPDFLSVYYKRRPKSDPQCQIQGAACLGVPRGLRFIFGYDMTKMMTKPDQPENTKHFYYTCVTPQYGHRGGTQTVLKGLPCLPGDYLTAIMSAPDCWDGKNLDSPDHRSHMAYAGYGNNGVYKCPSTHPYIVPTFTLSVNYKVQEGDVIDRWYETSSRMPGMDPMEPGKTFHSDFFMAWDDETKLTWEANCIDKMLNCSDGTLGNGQIMKRPPSYDGKTRPRVAIPPRP